MKIEELDSDQLMELYLGCVVGDAALAFELERLGLSDQEDSLLDAQRLRPRLLEAVDQERREQGGG